MTRAKTTPSWRDLPRNTLVVLTTGAATFALILLALGSLNQMFARSALRAQTEAVLSGFQQSVDQARFELSTLPPPEQLTCDSGISLVLAQRAFLNSALRWIAIEREGRLWCRSHVVGMDDSSIQHGPRTAHELGAGWSLESLQDPGAHHSLFLVQRRGNARYIASLEPPRLNYVSGFICDGCQAYTLTISGDPPLTLLSSPLAAPPLVQQSVQDRTATGLELALTLQAGPRFLDHYQRQGWMASILLATLLATGVGVVLHRILRARGSLDFLIREGLRQRAFVPFYQPIVDSRDGRLLGAEALVRWVSADGRIVSPGQFIPYAEETGLILPITDQLTEQVIRDIKRFGWAGTDRFVSINLVPEQLQNLQYVERLAALLQANNLSGHNVSIEITERRQFQDLANGRRVLGALVQQGIEVKLDDAGTGFGGFSYIQELPINTLKIDKMFIDTLRAEQDAKRSVLDAIVKFAHVSKLDTIAEGVETFEQVHQLASMGVYAIQGYVYGKPMHADELDRWMEAR
jgi:EAL domain-containing protein (putative c-di-GMP-specific phosphodiesterase class I)